MRHSSIFGVVEDRDAYDRRIPKRSLWSVWQSFSLTTIGSSQHCPLACLLAHPSSSLAYLPATHCCLRLLSINMQFALSTASLAFAIHSANANNYNWGSTPKPTNAPNAWGSMWSSPPTQTPTSALCTNFVVPTNENGNPYTVIENIVGQCDQNSVPQNVSAITKPGQTYFVKHLPSSKSSLTGHFTGNCALNGHQWVRVCYNQNPEALSYDTSGSYVVEYYGNDIYNLISKKLYVNAYGSVLVPSDYPYAETGACPYGLVPSIAICQPLSPTGAPTMQPTTKPTAQPTSKPTRKPTATPTTTPTTTPTALPTTTPTATPTTTPTATPTTIPTATPTTTPTATPTATPTTTPTTIPTTTPTATPTGEPTGMPTSEPTMRPTATPTATPTGEPTPVYPGTGPTCPGGHPVGASTYPNNPDVFTRFPSGFLSTCGGIPIPQRVASPYLISNNISTSPLRYNTTIVGTFTGDQCPLNGYHWIRLCYNGDGYAFNQTYYAYQLRKSPIQHPLVVAPGQVIPLPIGLPYIVDGNCPYGLISVVALCEPFIGPAPTGIPTAHPFNPTSVPTSSPTCTCTCCGCNTCKNSRSVTNTTSTTTVNTQSTSVTETTCLA